MKGFSEARSYFYAEPLSKQTATACVGTTSGKPSTRLPLEETVEYKKFAKKTKRYQSIHPNTKKKYKKT